MRAWLNGKTFALAAALLALVALSGSDVQSQQRRTSRRVTHPVRPRPAQQPAPTLAPESTDPTLISIADEQSVPATKRPAPKPPLSAEQQEREQRIERLAADFARMNKKLDTIEKQRQGDLLQERLTRAEQRAEALRTQLSQTLEKQSDLQARADQIEYNLRPESIELRAATVPSLHADDVRTQIRQNLESEKKRVRTQLDVLDSTRSHLEASIISADEEADRLRKRLHELIEKDAAGANDNEPSTPPPAPSPSAPPPAR